MSLSSHLGPPTGPWWSAVCVGCAKIPPAATAAAWTPNPWPTALQLTPEKWVTLANTSQKLRTPLGAILNSEITNTEAQKCRGKKVALNRPTQREPAHRPKSERRRQGTASSDPGRARVGQESISSAPLRPGHDPDGPARADLGVQTHPSKQTGLQNAQIQLPWRTRIHCDDCGEPRRWQALHLVVTGETAELLFYTGGASTKGRNPPHLGFGF